MYLEKGRFKLYLLVLLYSFSRTRAFTDVDTLLLTGVLWKYVCCTRNELIDCKLAVQVT